MCILRALKTRNNTENIRGINLRDIVQKGKSKKDIAQGVAAALDGFEPDAVCVSVGGNYHNILGIIENPVPFSVGLGDGGVVPKGSDDRQFIPSSVMEDMFRNYFDDHLVGELYGAFPSAKRLYLNPPPPIPDFEHIRKNPGIFRDSLHLGSAPNDLRLALYQFQSKVIADVARQNEAIFVEPEQSLLDEDGFLAEQFFSNDPTHGNVEYGQVMLDKLMSAAEVAQ